MKGSLVAKGLYSIQEANGGLKMLKEFIERISEVNMDTFSEESLVDLLATMSVTNLVASGSMIVSDVSRLMERLSLNWKDGGIFFNGKHIDKTAVNSVHDIIT